MLLYTLHFTLFTLLGRDDPVSNDAVVDDVLGYYGSSPFGCDISVGNGGLSGLYDIDQGFLFAEAFTAGLSDGYVRDPSFFEFIQDGGHNVSGSGGDSAGAHSDDYPALALALPDLHGLESLFTYLAQLFECLHEVFSSRALV